MRLALLTHQFPNVRLGGIGVYSLHAARALAATDEVHLFTFTFLDQPPPLPKNLTLHQIPPLAEQVAQGLLSPDLGMALLAGGEAMYRLGLAFLLSNALRTQHALTPFDLVEGPDYEALALPLSLDPAKTPDSPALITHLHSGSAVARRLGNLTINADDHDLRELLELALILSSDALVGPSRQAIADTRLAYHLPDLAADAQAIPLPFEPPAIPFTPPQPDAPILYIGRLEWLKGAHLLIDAANQFLPQNPAARLRIIGPDTMTAPPPSKTGTSMLAWMKARLDPALAPRVEFLGEQNRDAMQRELASCSFVVVPSLSETYSYVCCEALAAGRAVLVSDQIGATEVVANAGTTFKKADPADLARALSDLHRDPAAIQSLARIAFDRARTHLSGTAVIAQRRAVYETVIREKSARRAAAAERTQETLGTHLPLLQKTLAALHAHDHITLTQLAHTLAPNRPETPGTKLLRALESISPGPHRFHLYGAGRHTTRLLVEKPRWQAHHHQLVGLIDDHPRFQQTPHFMDLPVLSCAAATQQLPPTDIVILSTDAMEDLFWQQTAPLRARGITVLKLYGT